jgi:hypothetical protein
MFANFLSDLGPGLSDAGSLDKALVRPPSSARCACLWRAADSEVCGEISWGLFCSLRRACNTKDPPASGLPTAGMNATVLFS